MTTKPKTETAAHTPEPWHESRARTLINIKGPNGEQICQIHVNRYPDALRILAAVNACTSLSTEQVAGIPAKLLALKVTHEALHRLLNWDTRLNRKMARAALALADEVEK